MIRDCPSKRTLLIRDNGEYSSASDLDEDTYTLLAINHAGKDDVHDQAEEHIDTKDMERYESLIVQRVLSAQMEVE